MKQIDSVKNERVKGWKKLQTRKGRERSRKFLIEGYHLVEEALKAKVEIEAILVTEDIDVPLQKDEKLIYVSSAVMKELSETEAPQGMIAVCEMSEMNELHVEGKFLLVDRVQDPGNIGTMIRTADSAGMTAVILGDGCADVFNSKVIRASQGSIFHLPIIKGSLLPWIERLKKKGIPVLGTSLEGATSYKEIQPQDTFALIMGNEGEGVSKELLARTDRNIYVPIVGQAESLNVAVAAGILLFHLSN